MFYHKVYRDLSRDKMWIKFKRNYYNRTQRKMVKLVAKISKESNQLAI